MTDVLTELRRYQSQLKNGSVPAQSISVPLFYAMLENLLMGKPPVSSLVSFSTDYTVQVTDSVVLMDATANSLVVTLPRCADVVSIAAGTTKFFVIKKSDGTDNTVTIVSDEVDTIEGSASYALTAAFESVILCSDGNDWYVIATNGAGGGGGGGEITPIAGVRGFTPGVGYTRGANVFSSIDEGGLAVLFRQNVSQGGTRNIVGTEDQFGAGGMNITMNQETIGFRFWDSGGTPRTVSASIPPSAGLWLFVFVQWFSEGGNLALRMWLNGSVVAEQVFDGTDFGAPSGGVSLNVGGRGDTFVDRSAIHDEIHGVAWLDHYITYTVVAAWWEAIEASNTLMNIPGDTVNEGWRVEDLEMDSWVPFAGEVPLTLVGDPSLTITTDLSPRWKG